MYYLCTGFRANKFSTHQDKNYIYPEDPVEDVSKSIGLPFKPADETSGDSASSEAAPGSESDSSDVEKSVTSEHSDDEGWLAILARAVGPLLSMNVQRPRS